MHEEEIVRTLREHTVLLQEILNRLENKAEVEVPMPMPQEPGSSALSHLASLGVTW
jgi:hypothetical protein